MIKATLMNYMGSDVTVVNAARVSFGKKTNNNYTTDKDNKLIWYLAEHKHMSPFGHCFASFHVKAPIFVARQLVKHKFLRWNEISRRYVDDEPEFYEPKTWRGRAKDKKQGSDGVIENASRFLCEWDEIYCTFTDIDTNQLCLAAYHELLAQDVAPEQARMVLPQSTMTEWYWSGSLDAFADMCNLRTTDDTQYETRLAAILLSNKMLELFPVSWYELSRDKRR